MTISTSRETRNRSAFHVLTVTLGNMVGPLATLLCAPILAYQLGVEGRGELAASTMPLVLLGAALTMGLPEAITHRLGRAAGESRKTLRVACVMLIAAGVVASVGLTLLAPLLASGSHTVETLVRYSAIAAVPTVVLWALRGTAQGLHQWNTLNAEKAVTGLSKLTSIGILALCQYLTLESAFIVFVVSPLLGYMTYWRMLRRLPVAESSAGNPRIFKKIASFGSKVWLGSIAGILITRLDQVLILPLSSAEQLGLYASAVNVGDIPFFITAAFGSLILAKESATASNQRVAFASRTLFAIVFIVTSVAAGTSHLWFGILFGASFAGGALTSSILLLAALISAPGTIAGSTLTGRGHPHDRSLALGIGLLVNVALLFWLVPGLGAFGAGLATLGCTLVVTSVALMQIRWRLGIRVKDMILPTSADFRRVAQEIRRRPA